MSKRNFIFYILAAACLILAGCGRTRPAPSPAVTPAAGRDTTIPSPALPTAAAPSTPFSTGTARLPQPQVIQTAWDNRTVFQPGLIPAARGVLSALPGASVYHIAVAIAPNLASLSGQEEVLYTNRETTALDSIHFRLFPNLLGGEMTVSNVMLNGQAGRTSLSAANSDLAVALPAPLAPGGQAVVRMSFADRVPPGHPEGYNTFVVADGILALAQYYPLIPVYDEKGWHTEIPPDYGDVTYTDASFYLVQISCPADLVVAASGSVVKQAKEGDRQVILTEAGPVRDDYISASRDASVSSAEVGQTQISTYVPGRLAAAAPDTLRIAEASFASFNRRFGVYPYTRFNVTASPTQALGIEYPQEVAIAEQLYDPAQPSGSTPARVILEATLAHEISHQWWYGLVGDDQVNQPWLDEAMAQYSTYIYYLDNGGTAAAQSYRSDWQRRWDLVNDQPIPIGQPVAAYDAASYSAIVYGRGPLFIAALAERMGEASFDRFLRDYFQKYEWGISTTAGYEALAAGDCGCDLKPLFQEWVGP